ncbi:hypothetical protein J3458_020211 [Metarhizium acridum]|uniref:uncharacterized protein n=1 Tax=Metarhizium acridum TaxID=92637 RepID=UPI001C6B33D7|nr:hypothetical protein J3458_020211 [Metarhizium acridum]
MSNRADAGSGRIHLYVGIDFGTTFTGVYWMAPGLEGCEITPVRDWPGGYGEKVPTILAKETTENDRMWGFLCNHLDESSKWRFLKLSLDRDPGLLKGTPWAPNSPSETYALVEEYLCQVYRHISRRISSEILNRFPWLGGWESWEIDFIFSVPGTWSPPVVHRFLDTTLKAGFGGQAHHKVGLGLTESVAAVVAASEMNIPFSEGDTVLSIDAGGGTTDLAFVTLQSTKPVMMEQVLPATAIGIGSVMIDLTFKKLVEARLEEYTKSPDISKACAAEMSQGKKFQTWKCKYGPGQNLERKNVVDTNLIVNAFGNLPIPLMNALTEFKREELEEMFDCQLRGIQEHFMSAVDEFEKVGGKCVKHIVLSGGLGASDYVFEKLQEFLEWLKSRRPCLGEAKLVRYSDPPTAVVRGLLHDQKNAMFGPRVARASYGVVSEQVDSNNRQRGRDSQGQVAWVIKKGDTIQRHDRFRLKIARTFTSGDPEEWTVGIVSSSRSLKYLPENMQQSGVEVLYQVPIPLIGPPTEVKSRFVLLPRYQKYECELQLVVGDSGQCLVHVVSSRGVPLETTQARHLIALQTFSRR